MPRFRGTRYALLSSAAALSSSGQLLLGESDGMAFDFTAIVPNGTVKDAATPANNFSGTPDAWWTNSGTSPKLVLNSAGLYAWSPHNMFLNSDVPATQSVTTITGATYTVTVTGSGSLVGSSGASGTATQASPLTFVASGTTSTFTLSGSLTRIQMNRGTVATAYLATTSAIKIGLPIEYPNGLLVEPAATNFITSFSNTGIGAGSGSEVITVDNVVAPDGTQTADTIAFSQGDFWYFNTAIILAAGTYTGSVFMKAAAPVQIGIAITESIAGTPIGVRVVNVTTAWQRFHVTFTSDSSDTVAFGLDVRSFITGDDNAAKTVHVWGWTVEAGTVATSPIPTFEASVPVTRAADVVSALTSTIPFSATKGTVYADYTPPVATGTQVVWQLDDTTANERIILFRSTNDPLINVVDGGVAQLAPMDVGTITGGARSQTTFAWKVNLFAGSHNGGASVDDTIGTLPTVTTFRLGRDSSGSQLNGYLRRIVYVPRQIEEDGQLVETWRYVAP